MNVHISYRIHKTPALEKDIQHHIDKLQKRLQVFRPELVHLKGMVEENSAREGFNVSLNLRLPSGQMAAQATTSSAEAAIKAAFDELLQQVNKHKELLRSTHKWPRRQREFGARRNSSVPFEQTVAAVFPASVSADDIRSYVNANLSRLERFVEREIYFREASDLIGADSVSKEEVIDETVAAALGENQEKPDRMALEPWLYKLAMKALDQLSRSNESDNGAIPLDSRNKRKNEDKDNEEPELQFESQEQIEQVDEESVRADRRASTPEQIVGSDEMMRLIASALRDVKPSHREAFILHVMEGFGVDEISAITGAPAEHILHSISAARDHLRKSPAFVRQVKGRTATGTA